MPAQFEQLFADAGQFCACEKHCGQLWQISSNLDQMLPDLGQMSGRGTTCAQRQIATIVQTRNGWLSRKREAHSTHYTGRLGAALGCIGGRGLGGGVRGLLQPPEVPADALDAQAPELSPEVEGGPPQAFDLVGGRSVHRVEVCFILFMYMIMYWFMYSCVVRMYSSISVIYTTRPYACKEV